MQTQNLEITKGNDQVFIVTFSDKAGPIVINEWTVSFVVKEQKSLAVVIDKKITNHSDPMSGITRITLTNQETNIKKGSYKYLLSVRTGANEVYSLLSGIIVIREP